MCGRFTLRTMLMAVLIGQFEINLGTEIQLPLRDNVAPTQTSPWCDPPTPAAS